MALPDAGIRCLLSGGLASSQRGVTIIALDEPTDPFTAASSGGQLQGAGHAPGVAGEWAPAGGAQLGRIVYCNEAFEALCGRGSRDLLGCSFDLLIGPDTDPEQVGRLREALHGEQPDTVQLRCYHSSGATFWNSISIGPIPTTDVHLASIAVTAAAAADTARLAAPTQRFFLALHHDVSALVLDQDGFRLRDLALHSCSEGITLVDPNLPEMPIVYVNDAFLDMTGYTREEVLGRNCRFLQGPGTDAAAISRLRKALQQHHKCTVQLVNYRKDGRRFWNLLSVTPVFDSSGRLTSYIGVQSDISELVARKEEEQRAVEAKVAAETAMEAKSMFLANMSHEIRTPLNGMMAMAQLLLGSVLTPEQRDLAETILESSTSLLGILGDILDFSKLDQGAVQLQRRPFCLRDTIEACIEMVAGDALKKGLQVAYLMQAKELAAGRLLIGDPVRVRQILANLVSNAVKFTEHGDVVVTVTVESPGFGRARRMAVEKQQAPRQAPRGGSNSSSSGWALAAAGSSTVAVVPAAVVAAGIVYKRGSSGLSAVSPCSICGTASSSLSSLYHHHDGGSSATGASAMNPASNPDPSMLSRHDSGWDNSGAGGGAPGAANTHTTTSSTSGGSGAFERAAAVAAGPAASEPALLTEAISVSDDESFGDGTGSSSRPLPEIHVAVSDTGIGISGTQAALLFQCFKQGAESMSRRYGGTGLGLAICRQLTELMGGEIWVDSELGRGSTFHITIPAQWAPQPPSPESAAAAAAQQARRADAESVSPQSWIPMPSNANVPTQGPVVPASSEEAASGTDPLCLPQDAQTPRLSGSSVFGEDRSRPESWSTGAMGGGHDSTKSGQLPVLSPQLGQRASMHAQAFPPPPSTSSELSDAGLQGFGAYPAPVSGPGPDDFVGLQGKRVLVDIVHAPTSLQVLQSCRLLGLHAEAGDVRAARTVAVSATASPAATGTRAPASTPGEGQAAGTGTLAGAADSGGPYDLAVVGMEHAVDAIRHAWKGRPLVVLGNKSSLPGNLHPLAVFVPLPVRHARLASALLKSMVLLKWLPNGSAPKLSDDTISQHVIQDFKNWRMRQASSTAEDYARRTSLDNSALCRRNVAISLPAAQQQAQLLAQQQAQLQAQRQAQGLSGSGSDVAAANGLQRIGNNSKCVTSYPEPIPENAAVSETCPSPTSSLPCWAPGPGSWAPPLLSYGQQQRHRQQQVALAEAAEHMAVAQKMQLQATVGQGPFAASAQGQHAGANAKPSLRILIAEDNKVNQKVVLKVLQRICASECQPDVVENGLQVLHAIEAKRYDLILMDIHMPEMDGLEASRRICQRFPKPEDRPRIVALSADTMQSLHDRCREAGIEEFILKPFRVEDLKRVMNVCSHIVTSRREELVHTLGTNTNSQSSLPLVAT